MTISSVLSILPLDKSLVPDFVKNPYPEIYLGDRYAVVDFECTNLDKGSALNKENRLLLTVCRVGPRHPQAHRMRGGRFVFFGSEYEQRELLDIIGESDFIVAHHTKFELQWISRMGGDLRRILPYCTQIGEYVYRGNRKGRLDLGALAREYKLGKKSSVVSAMIRGGVCPSEIPPELLQEYCENDVFLTEGIFLRQREKLAENGLLPVTYCRNLFTPVLADMETEGMQLDSTRVIETFNDVSSKFNQAKSELDDFTGGINQNSPKQLREYLYETLGFEPVKDYRGTPVCTSKGKLSTSKAVIGQLVPRSDDQRGFIEIYRRLIPLKKRIQLLGQLKECCENDNGKLYAAFNQAITQTHRLSSSGRKYGIQFHNFPRDYKSLFCSRDAEFFMVEGDSPQLEFRIAVDAGDDANGMRAICTGVDVHELTSRIIGIGRTPAKAFTFKPLYGGTTGSRKERAYYDAFRREYSGVYNTQTGWVYKVLADKSLRIASGLVFYWPDTRMLATGYVTNTPSIFNYPIQSFATADIVPLCVLLVWHRSTADERFRLVNTVHDSLVAEVHKDVLQYYKEVIKEAFTKDIYLLIERLYGRTINVPLGVGIKVGSHWGEGEEEKIDAVEKIEAYLSGALGNDVGRTGGRSKQILGELHQG